MESHLGLRDLVKTEAESARVINTTETHDPEKYEGSRARPDEATFVMQEQKQGESLEFLQASEFVRLIKEHFPSDREVLKRFLDVLESYYSETKSVQVLYREAANIFNGHELLLRVLPLFMPEAEEGQATRG